MYTNSIELLIEVQSPEKQDKLTSWEKYWSEQVKQMQFPNVTEPGVRRRGSPIYYQAIQMQKSLRLYVGLPGKELSRCWRKIVCRQVLFFICRNGSKVFMETNRFSDKQIRSTSELQKIDSCLVLGVCKSFTESVWFAFSSITVSFDTSQYTKCHV